MILKAVPTLLYVHTHTLACKSYFTVWRNTFLCRNYFEYQSQTSFS